MKITCGNCGQSYLIDTTKLPPGDKITTPCQKCKASIVFNTDKSIKKSFMTEISADEKVKEGLSHHKNDSEYYEFFESGKLTALIYSKDPYSYEVIKRSLHFMKYEIRTVQSNFELLERLNYHDYDILVLNQSSIEPDAKILDMINSAHRLPREKRRNLFVLYILPQGNTSNTYLAFSMGVNMTMSTEEIEDFVDIITAALQLQDVTYRPFKIALSRSSDNMLY
jgi:predicted Zn finger-like uncharacterized protein